MFALRNCFVFPILSLAFVSFGQDKTIDLSRIVFRDTVSDIVFDSILHNLGNIVPVNENNHVIKYFKYLGKDPIFITRAWTTDPHFICEYPREPLLTNQIYSFTTCFWFQGQAGSMSKTVGLEFSDGTTVTFKFKGIYLSEDSTPKSK